METRGHPVLEDTEDTLLPTTPGSEAVALTKTDSFREAWTHYRPGLPFRSEEKMS